jgi:hypothetical protein
MKAICPFEIDSFDATEPEDSQSASVFNRAVVKKTFSGDLEGHGRVEMMAHSEDDGRGYVALEIIEGKLHGKEGSFCFLHAGTQGAEGQWARWRVVPGSGQGELAGITGEGEIEFDKEGAHTLVLDYELGQGAD